MHAKFRITGNPTSGYTLAVGLPEEFLAQCTGHHGAVLGETLKPTWGDFSILPDWRQLERTYNTLNEARDTVFTCKVELRVTDKVPRDVVNVYEEYEIG